MSVARVLCNTIHVQPRSEVQNPVCAYEPLSQQPAFRARNVSKVRLWLRRMTAWPTGPAICIYEFRSMAAHVNRWEFDLPWLDPVHRMRRTAFMAIKQQDDGQGLDQNGDTPVGSAGGIKCSNPSCRYHVRPPAWMVSTLPSYRNVLPPQQVRLLGACCIPFPDSQRKDLLRPLQPRPPMRFQSAGLAGRACAELAAGGVNQLLASATEPRQIAKHRQPLARHSAITPKNWVSAADWARQRLLAETDPAPASFSDLRSGTSPLRGRRHHWYRRFTIGCYEIPSQTRTLVKTSVVSPTGHSLRPGSRERL